MSYGQLNNCYFGKPYNRLSLEASGGLQVPFARENNYSRLDFLDFKEFQVAARYMFNPKWGLRAYFGYNRFTNSNKGLSMKRIGGEGVLNISNIAENESAAPILRNFRLLGHVGGGLGFDKSLISGRRGTDKVLNIQLGLTALYKLNNRFALSGDITYVHSFKMFYDFNGTEIKDEGSGGFGMFNIGLVYYLGGNKDHADWY